MKIIKNVIAGLMVAFLVFMIYARIIIILKILIKIKK